jgi:hypothetical protein
MAEIKTREKSKGIKALVAAIAAGGWVALIVIVIICLIAAIAGMGTMPLWISDMVSGSVSTIISQLMN